MRPRCSTLSHLPGPHGASLRWVFDRVLDPPPRRTWRRSGGRRENATPGGSGDRESAIVPFLTPGAFGVARGCRRGHSRPAAAGSRSFSSFSRRSSEEGRKEGCWSSGRLGAAGTSGGGRMWSRRRGAGLHRPQPLSRRVGTFPNPPSLRCGLGQVCACELVSAICRVHLSTPGSHCSLRLDLAPRFCGVGGGGGLGTCRGNRRADGAQCKVEELQVTSPGPGMHIQA